MSKENSGCLFVLLHLLGLMPKSATQELPYRVRDDFLSLVERTFYAALVASLAEQAVVCPKVRLGDILFTTDRQNFWKHTNHINQKHIDFLVCSRETMRPLAAIELDDSSHQRESAQESDQFKDDAFEAAGLPLLRFPARRSCNAREIASILLPHIQNAAAPRVASHAALQSGKPICPKCGVGMVQRTASKGTRAGKPFYGCPNYPRCRETIDIA